LQEVLWIDLHSLPAAFESSIHVSRVELGKSQIREAGAVNWILLDQLLKLFRCFLEITHQEVVATACPVFLALGFAINMRKRQLVVMDGLLSLSLVRKRHCQPCVCATHIRIECGSFTIGSYSLRPLAFPLQLLSRGVLLSACE